jgi:NTP pyrophosphatase (non-canonical NTP hydrolase)|tara:strand:- start:6486 stop:6893 length:408 start_codon:yes stop_codon:yes gene_type:complete
LDIDLKRYEEFVEKVTSVESNVSGAFFGRVQELEQTTDVNIPLLLTASIGLSSEGGEFSEIVKKCLFQGKPLDDETAFHLKRELGDIMWYWTNACRSLGLDPNSVVAENVKKLKDRYPGGEFDVYHSENRKSGDL